MRSFSDSELWIDGDPVGARASSNYAGTKQPEAGGASERRAGIAIGPNSHIGDSRR